MADNQETLAAAAADDARRARRRAAALFAVVALVWLALDQATKAYFNGFELGQDIAGPFLGLFQFTLVHNTGAAWGLFSGSTAALGVVSLAVSAAVAVLAVRFAPRSNALLVLGAALVAAGGIGNAIDRFALGYVVDFIEASFIDFPVFNVADIGVTCGVVLAVVALAFFWKDAEPAPDAVAKDALRTDDAEGEGAR